MEDDLKGILLGVALVVAMVMVIVIGITIYQLATEAEQQETRRLEIVTDMKAIREILSERRP